MLHSTSLGAGLARLFLFPGDLVCTAFGLDSNDKRELVRMLFNSLVWIFVGMLAVVALA